MADLFELLVEGPAVAGDLAEVALDAHEFIAGAGFGVLDDFFGQAHLAGQFEGEGVAGQAHLQFEERGDVLGVELHGAVDDAAVPFPGRVEFEVGVVGRDDPVHAAAVELGEDGFGDGAAGSRFGAGAEFVNQHEGAVVRFGEDVLHRSKEGAICTQVVVNGLAVADIDHDAVEEGHLGGLGGWDEHTPLEHVLQQADGLQADGLAAGVRAGDEEDVLGGGEAGRQRDDGLAFAAQGFLQQRVPGLAQVHLAVLREGRHAGDVVQGGLGLGHDEIEFADHAGAADQVGDLRADVVAEVGQDLEDLAAFSEVQFGDFVFEFDDFSGLDEGRFAR